MLGAGLDLSPQAVRAARAMIGYSTPTLDLNFLYGVMPPGVTFTRASTADYIDVGGVARTAAVDQPRLTAGGLMVFDAAAAGAAELVSLPVGAWFTASAGTLLVEWSVGAVQPTGIQTAATFDDGTTSNRLCLFAVDSTGLTQDVITASGAAQYQKIWPAATAGAVLRQAMAWAANDANSARNGTLAGSSDTAVTLPTITALRIGHRVSGSPGAFLNGSVRRLRYWPVRLSNSVLQSITA